MKAVHVLLLLLLLLGFCEAANLVKNPGFEDDLEGWAANKACEIVTQPVHSGKKALHCKDTTTSEAVGVYQNPPGVLHGVRYYVSAWIRAKGLKDGSILLCAESSNYKYGVYVSSNKIEECKDGTCDDKWYQLNGTSEMFFGEASWYVFLARLNGAGATGEFWLDDLVMEVQPTNILNYIETTAWKQEVFEDPIEIYVDLEINNSVWHNGTNFTLKVDIVEEGTGTVVDTLTSFTLGYRAENRIATFQYDPSGLEPGFYKVRATTVNEIFDNYTETIETNLRKLDKKRELTFYVDQKTMIAYDHGKKFFPLGLYMNQVNDTDIDLITDSPFNIMVSNAPFTRSLVDHIHNRSGGRIRSMPAFGGAGANATAEDKFQHAVKRINELRDSPGLLGYYIADEPGPGRTAELRRITLAARDLDPNHVTYAAVNQRLYLHTLKEGFDVVGIDCYPVQHYDDLHAIYVMGRQARKRTCNARARWDIPQIFDWTVYDQPNENPPTEQQLRQMTYQWIVSGGMGIIYYDFSELQVMDYKNPFVEEWAKVKRVANELVDKYVPIILSGYPGSPRFYLPPMDTVSGANYVGWRTWSYNRYTYILIVNVKAAAQTYKFIKPHDINFSSIQMIMGDSKMSCDGDTITLEMPGTEVVWLRVEDPQYYPDRDKGVRSAEPAIIVVFASLVLLSARAAF